MGNSKHTYSEIDNNTQYVKSHYEPAVLVDFFRDYRRCYLFALRLCGKQTDEKGWHSSDDNKRDYLCALFALRLCGKQTDEKGWHSSYDNKRDHLCANRKHL